MSFPSFVPYAPEYAVLVLIQAAAVLLPRRVATIGSLGHHTLLGLLPLAAIGGLVVAMDSYQPLVSRLVDLAAIGTPFAMLLGLVAYRRSVAWFALLAVPAYWIAWKHPGGTWADLSTDVLILGAGATLAWLTTAVAPRVALAIGIVLATIVDVYQVLVTQQVQVVSNALEAAMPPSGLPHLQEAQLHGSTMGWGDVYLAALLGTLVAHSRRTRVLAAAAVAVGGLIEGFGFNRTDTLPATVPVAVALLAACLSDRVTLAGETRDGGDRSHGNDGAARREASDRRRLDRRRWSVRRQGSGDR